MDWSWLPPITLVGAALLFVTNAWKLLQEHSSLRRLERLSAMRGRLEPGSAALQLVDEAVERLAERVASRERPKNLSRAVPTFIVLTATAVGVITLVGLLQEALLPSVDGQSTWLTGLGAALLGIVTAGIGSIEVIDARKRRKREQERREWIIQVSGG